MKIEIEMPSSRSHDGGYLEIKLLKRKASKVFNLEIPVKKLKVLSPH